MISAYLLRDILNATSGWWQSWHVRAPNLGTLTDLIIRRPLGPWPIEYTTAANYTTLQDFLLFAYNSEIPAVVGLAVLCIAECLRKLFMPTHEALISQLPRPPQELFQILLERVDRLINTDGDFSNTKAGIDCLMMSGKLYQGLGLPKRSWLSFHKGEFSGIFPSCPRLKCTAIVYAEFHGLHRFLPQPGESKEDCQIRRNAWDNLCQTDLFISMTLGLPYAASGRNIPPSYFGEPGTLLWFQKQVMDAAAQLIDRNQSGLMNDEIPTRAITDLLDVAASKMHPEFWNGPQLLRQATSNRRQAIESTTKQMFYWLIRLFNHLPFSIQSIEQPQLEGHRFACQAGCRGMLTIYNVMRSDKILDAANLIDYQAFISSSILLLGLLGYGNSPTSYTQIDHDADRDLVSMTLQVLHETSNTGNNTVAAEAVEGLESLFMLTDPAAHHAAREMDLKELKTRIKIPYIGTIYIAPGEQLQRTHPATPESFPALPCFTFSHPEMTGSPFQPYQVPDLIPPNCVPNPLSQIPSGGPQDMMNTEFTSIDFEFDTLMAMNPWDWSWITAEIQPEQYQ